MGEMQSCCVPATHHISGDAGGVLQAQLFHPVAVKSAMIMHRPRNLVVIVLVHGPRDCLREASCKLTLKINDLKACSAVPP